MCGVEAIFRKNNSDHPQSRSRRTAAESSRQGAAAEAGVLPSRKITARARVFPKCIFKKVVFALSDKRMPYPFGQVSVYVWRRAHVQTAAAFLALLYEEL